MHSKCIELTRCSDIFPLPRGVTRSLKAEKSSERHCIISTWDISVGCCSLSKLLSIAKCFRIAGLHTHLRTKKKNKTKRAQKTSALEPLGVEMVCCNTRAPIFCRTVWEDQKQRFPSLSVTLYLTKTKSKNVVIKAFVISRRTKNGTRPATGAAKSKRISGRLL